MVRVISAHHFAAQDVSSCPAPCCSVVAGDLLLLASPLHQVEVRDLTASVAPSHTFPTVDLVDKMVFSPVGRYLAILEKRDQLTFVRVYLNWWSSEAASQPMRARVPGLTPSHQGELSLEMIELEVKEPVTGISVCPATGNLVLVTGLTLLLYKYCIMTTPKCKYTDFQECLHISLPFPPSEVELVEDTVACLHPTQLHVFKVGLVEEGGERGMRSLSSTYSFSSESECSLENKEEPKGSGAAEAGRGGAGGPGGVLKNPNLSNVTARRRADSSSEREVQQQKEGSGMKLHPGHVTIGGSSSEEEEEEGVSGLERVQVPLVEREERELGSLSTPRLLVQSLGPLPCPSVTVSLVGSWAQSLAAEAVTLIQAQLPEQEWRHERLRLLRLQPVYWREWRVRRGAASSPSPHSPLHSAWHPHLMSLSLVVASVHEGYLYHIPGHLRRPGRGVGVQRIATYPFTSPVQDLVLEPSLLHALTETGLETYTLRAGYHTVREAEAVDGRTNALPPASTPICLIGLRPFLGVRSLLLAPRHLVLLSEPSGGGGEWTVYSLHLPSHSALFQDMLEVADMNAGAPHGFLQLVSEAHVVARTWLHRLAWLQVTKPGGEQVTGEEVEEARTNYRTSCLRLADHYVQCGAKSQHGLAVPYYRLSQLPPLEVLARLGASSPPVPGLVGYIEEILLRPVAMEEFSPQVADRVISLLGQHSLGDLTRLVLASPALRGFKTRQSLQLLETSMAACSEVAADPAMAAVLVGGSGSWLARVAPVHLATALLQHHHLLLEPGPGGRDGNHCFSSFALELRQAVPVVFAEVCVSLIQSSLLSLGQLLHLLLQSFMATVTSPGDSAESAGILQFFLETYFIELLGDGAVGTLDGDQQQALVTLLRSYLAGLSHPLPGPVLEDCMLPTGPGDMFGPRHDYLDLLPATATASPTLLKLQSLLSSPYSDDVCRQTVAKYVEEHAGLEGEVSLLLLSLTPGSQGAKLLCSKGLVLALAPYCHSAKQGQAELWGEALHALLHTPNCPARQEAVDRLLTAMAAALPPSSLGPLLPQGEQYGQYLALSKSQQQAARLQDMIVQTGGRLLESLTL